MIGVTLNRSAAQLPPSGIAVNRVLSGQDFLEGWTGEGGGTVWHPLNGRYPLTLHGTSPTWSASPLGMAINFDGSTVYADSAAISGFGSFTYPYSFTVSLWFKSSSNSTRQCILGDYDAGGANQSFTIEIGGFLQSNGTINASWGSTYLQSGVSITPGRWYHVVVSFDEAYQAGRMYVNGNYKGSTPWSGNAGSYPAGTKCAFGRGGAFAALYLSGSLTLPLIWKRVLHASEVMALYTMPYSMLSVPRPRLVTSPPAAVSHARSFAVIIG